MRNEYLERLIRRYKRRLKKIDERIAIEIVAFQTLDPVLEKRADCYKEILEKLMI